MEKKEIERFKATSDDGQIFELIIFQEIINNKTLNGKESFLNGLKTIETADGHTVTPKEDSSYEIIELGLIVKKI